MRLLRVVMLAAVAAIALEVSASAALTVAWPRENAVVRETVNVAVLASSVPADSYVSFYLNDNLMVAVGAASTISGGRQAYNWVWDTREPVNLGRPNDPPKVPEDGRYTITIKAVRGDQVVDQAVVNVRLANKVTSISPNTPVTLRYNYRQGMRKKYLVRIGVSMAEVGGAKMSSPQEFQTFSYVGVGSVEDIRGDGLALLRYRPVENSFTVYGQKWGELPGFAEGSIYQVVNNLGRVVAADLFSTVGLRTSPALAVDFRVPLPRDRVVAGQSWTGSLGLSMPGLGEAMRLEGTSFRLDSLEWAGGKECALVKSSFSGPTTLQIVAADPQLATNMYPQAAAPGGVESGLGGQGGMFGANSSGLGGQPFGALGGPSPSVGMTGGASGASATGTISGDCSDWFAFRTGELVRRQLTAMVDARMDQSVVQKLNEGLGLSNPNAPPSAQPAGPQPYGDTDDMINQYENAYSRVRGALEGLNSRGAAPDGGSQTTPVKFRITLSARLMN